MSELLAVKFAYLIPLLPLLGAIASGFFGAKFLKDKSHWPIWIGVGASALISFSLLFGVLKYSGHDEGHADEHATHAEAPRSAADFPAVSKKWFDWILAGGTDARLAHHNPTPGHPNPSIADADGTTHKLAPFYVQAGAWIDPLTAVMLCVVTGIGFLITVFAAGYMKGEKGYFRFFAYLGLFLFSMTCLVMGNNFVMLYLGWEGVGLCSYLLIGYYYEKPAAREAAKKAFLVNRIGDFGFGLGIMLIFLAFGTVSYFGDGIGTISGVLEMAAVPHGLMSPFQHTAMQWIPFLLMVGAFGKSAQFPLYVWLPDAMEGPTPVSALIHAATMVTAGVYMIVRCGTLFVTNAPAMWTIACVGAFTALFAATIALRQFDLKKVFAYSTISQLGFMFVGVGVLAPVAGIFHLMTHAFFKALLFLSSGVVMHAMLGHLDMRKMSGLKHVLPKTRWLMLIGCLALAGFPFFSGFFSKDEIVHHAWEKSYLLGAVMLFTAFLTAYYTFRLYFRVFEGPEMVPTEPAEGHHAADDQASHGHASASAIHAGDAQESGVDQHLATAAHQAATDTHDHGHHNHEPAIMILPLIILAVGALVAGYLNWPSEKFGHFLNGSPSVAMAFNLAASQPGTNIDPTGFGAEALDRQGQPIEHSPFNSIMLVSGLISMLGILLAYQVHLADRRKGDELPARYPRLSQLLEAKYYVDEIYQAAIVEPLRTLGRAFFLIDQMVVDGFVWLVGFVPQASGFALKLTTQRGYLQGYAASMLFGVAVILLVIFW